MSVMVSQFEGYVCRCSYRHMRHLTLNLSGSGQGTLLAERMADGAEKFWSGDREAEDVALEGRPLGGPMTW